jgi:hypothetical protein
MDDFPAKENVEIGGCAPSRADRQGTGVWQSESDSLYLFRLPAQIDCEAHRRTERLGYTTAQIRQFPFGAGMGGIESKRRRFGDAAAQNIAFCQYFKR